MFIISAVLTFFWDGFSLLLSMSYFSKHTHHSILRVALLSICCLLTTGCSDPSKKTPVVKEKVDPTITLNGTWLYEQDNSIMSDPQTSGLISVGDRLVSVSDGSALPYQRRRLHFIDPTSAVVIEKTQPMTMSSRVRRSCFAQYLSDEPDFEALVTDPIDPSVFIIVTEDATRTGALSPRCQEQYSDTGSTAYPTLLVRAKLESGKLTMTHVRPLQYPQALAVGDFPNDGIEGLAFDKERNLYLGLEKDAAGQPRIFSVTIGDGFWQESDFARVQDPKLLLPSFAEGNHPINGMDYLHVNANHRGLIVAAARNDDQLWLIDLEKKLPPQIIDLRFQAPTLVANSNTAAAQCEDYETMDNASLEGVAVKDDTIWLINDPWKRNYMKNLQCKSNEERYRAMAPLLFSLPIQSEWLLRYQ